MYKIEKNVPVTRKAHPGRPSKYPLKDMVVGDSFLVPYGDMPPERLQATVGMAALDFGRKNGGKFQTSRQETGIRVWRIE